MSRFMVSMADDLGFPGMEVVVKFGNIRIDLTLDDPSRPIPVDETDKELMTLVIAQLRQHGIGRKMILSTPGRLMVWALAKHVRYSMESDAPAYDFGGLPIVAELPRERRLLAGITQITVT